MATEQQQWIESIEKLLVDAKKEEARLKAGIRCAAPKLRGHLKEVSELCKAGRVDALQRGKAIPPKPKKAAKKSEAAASEPVAEPEGELTKGSSPLKREPVAASAPTVAPVVTESKEPSKAIDTSVMRPFVSRKPRKPVPASA